MIVLVCAWALAMTPDEAVRAATAFDPTLAEADAERLEAKGERRAASGLRHNPELELAADLGGARLEASVTQPLSLTGAGFADARSGRFRAEAAETDYHRALLTSAAEARRAWAVLAAAEGRLRAAEAERRGAAVARSATEARRGVGEASDLALELARLDEARAVAGWLQALDTRAQAQAALAALTGDASAAAEGDPMLAAPRPGSAGVRSDLVAALARVEAANAALARERAEVLPALGLGVFVEQDDNGTLLGPAVQVELPIWQQNADGRGQASAALRVAEAQLSATRARAEAEQAAATARLDALAGAGAGLAPEVERSAEVALRAIELGVTTGELNPIQAAWSRAQVFEGQRSWYDARLAEAEARIGVALATENTGLLAL